MKIKTVRKVIYTVQTVYVTVQKFAVCIGRLLDIDIEDALLEPIERILRALYDYEENLVLELQ